jgi:glycosyltransferase involved in cell wall biosynthesis
LKILHVIENLNTGGAERMLINLAIAQAGQDHQVAVICLFELGNLAPSLTDQGISVTACYKKPGFTLSFIGKLCASVKKFAPDVIHCHSLMANYYLAFVKLLFAPRATQILTRHGLLRGGNINRLNLLFHLSLFMTDWAVGVCDSVSQELFDKHAFFSRKILTINNGINLDTFVHHNSHSKSTLINSLNLDQNSCIIGIIARLNPVKNHQLLIDAFSLIKAKIAHSKLIIVGDGVLRQTLEDYTKRLHLDSEVIFLGDRSDISDLLASFDVFVLSSNNEGNSLALMEAAAASLPLVATNVGGNATIVSHNHSGYIVEPNEPNLLADALISVLSNPKKSREMGEFARRWVEENGSIEAMTNTYLALYRH